MADNGTLALWEKLKQMVDAEIDSRTRSCCRLKSMVVSSQYDETTKLVGVMEAFGDEITIPVYATVDVAKLSVGTPVWVLTPYGSMSNAMVCMLGNISDGTTAADAAKLGGKGPSAYLDVRDLTADELTAMDTAARAALYADGARVLKVTNGETVVLLTLNAEGATQWAGGEMPRNLLDNSDFTNPVNQRGVTSFAGGSGIVNGYISADRWLFYGTGTAFEISDRLKATNDGTATCGVAQRLMLEAGKTYTLACKAKITGTVYLSYGINGTANTGSKNLNADDELHVFTFTAEESSADGLYNARIRTTASACTIQMDWLDLYEGSYTADTLPPHVPKDKNAELDACHERLYYFDQLYQFVGSGFIATDGQYAFISVPVPYLNADAKPTVTGNVHIAIPKTTADSAPTASIFAAELAGDGWIRLQCTLSTTDTTIAGQPCAITIRPGDYLQISREL